MHAPINEYIIFFLPNSDYEIVILSDLIFSDNYIIVHKVAAFASDWPVQCHLLLRAAAKSL